MSNTVSTPMPEIARRIEIFTGAGRRRRWSAEEKAAILAECESSGEGISAVARRHGLTASQVFAWRRRGRCGVAVQTSSNGFATVVLEKGTPAGGDWLMEIALDGATVRLCREVDARLIGTVLRALRG